jgi:C-terminal processing protease CtpA/Prc
MNKYKYLILAFVFIGLTSCEKVFFETQPENNPEALFEDLWSTFNTGYANFEERGVDWQEQYNIYRPQVTQSTAEEELYSVFKQMLSSLNDGHVSLTIPDQKEFISNQIIEQEIDDDLFDLNLIKTNYMTSDPKVNGYDANTYGWIGDVGYVHLQWISDNIPDVNDILDYFSSAKGIVFDLRHNGGGDFTWAYNMFSRLTNEERYVHRSKTKNGEGPDDYTDWYNWNIYPSGEYFDKPIVLLTDRYTISAGERMVMAFKVLPNVTHLGDTTNGAIATKIGKELANGWYYTVVTQKIEFVDGVSYEGPGIPPDSFMKNTSEEMVAGQDKSLEAALEQF